MKKSSLYRSGVYSQAWIKDFYDQASIWWGADPQEEGVHPGRVKTVERLCGKEPKRILELGAGSGTTASAMADHGHEVVAVELSPVRANLAKEFTRISRAGSLAVVEGDFYSVILEGKFDVVCCWETFGLGNDSEQRRLLERIAREWLKPGGTVLMDVYNPFCPARNADKQQVLPPLEGVPGSVEMFNRCRFDPVQCRWIDEWEPTASPQQALAQAIRCYSPADLQLLLLGTGLVLKRIEVEDEPLDFQSNAVRFSGPLLDAWSYLALLSAG